MPKKGHDVYDYRGYVIVFQIYGLYQNKIHAEDVKRSLQASDLCPEEVKHASYGALHLPCNVHVEISASDKEISVSKSEQQWATEDTQASFQIQINRMWKRFHSTTCANANAQLAFQSD